MPEIKTRIVDDSTWLESKIEQTACAYAKSRGLTVYKFSSPQRASVPDRLFITPTGTVFFVEFKRRGNKPTPAQDRELERLHQTRVWAFWCDRLFVAKIIIDAMMHL